MSEGIGRTCALCEHFHFDSGVPDYSSWTPGSPMTLECRKGHWDADDCCVADDLRKALCYRCDDFTPYDLKALRRRIFPEEDER